MLLRMHSSSSFYHEPVLLDETVSWLVTNRDGLYVDATLGGGGHTAEIISRLSENGRVIGIDQDDDAIASATARLQSDPRFSTMRMNFADALDEVEEADGVLMDLGVSSRQLDDFDRGFSYRGDGPLDMRMQQSSGSLNAWVVVNEFDEAELARVLRVYGEDPAAKRVARAIVRSRPLETTKELAEVVERQVPFALRPKTLSRVFQGIRIVVNDELGVLERALARLPHVLKPGGRLVVIAYHSLEDRRVKRMLKSGGLLDTVPPKDHFGNSLSPWKELIRRPQLPTDTEISRNPRARSAKLRVAERTVH